MPENRQNPDAPLAGRSVLVVEDEFMLADEMRELLEQLGGEVIGPVASAEAALGLIGTRSPDLALLDVNLRGERVYPVAAALRGANVPFVFTTGYDRSMIDGDFRDAPRLEKPFSVPALLEILRGLPKTH